MGELIFRWLPDLVIIVVAWRWWRSGTRLTVGARLLFALCCLAWAIGDAARGASMWSMLGGMAAMTWVWSAYDRMDEEMSAD